MHPHRSPTYRPDIDGLRAIAVIGVLLFHAFPSLLRGGFVGVDVFFVISGYLITRTIVDDQDRGEFSIGSFYARRIRRIFPALIAVLIPCFLFGWHTMLAEDLARLAKQTLGGAGFVANLLLWSDAGYFDQASASKPLLHLWSLGVEEQFYVLWPLLLWVARKVRLPLLPVIACTALASFAFNLYCLRHDAVEAFYSPLSRGWELMVGGAIAHGMPGWNRHGTRTRDGSPAMRSLLSLAGLLFIAYAMVRIDEHLPFPGKWALFPTVGAACLILAGPDSVVSRWILSCRPMVWIGLISYPLYLWHWPLLVFARQTLEHEPTVLERIVILSLGVVLAWATWRLIEKPLRSGQRGGLKVAGLSLAMTVVAAAAAVTVHFQGVPSRYPAMIQRATEYDLEGYRTALRNHVCFMESTDSTEHLMDQCIDAGTTPLWVIWGDSAGAAIYPGMRALQERRKTFRLGQLTTSACAPIIGMTSPLPYCEKAKVIALDAIRRLRPDTVILAAMWQDYDKDMLLDTVKTLQASGVKRVVLLGPAPAWMDTPARIVFDRWRNDPLHAAPSARLDYQKYALTVGRGGRDERTASAEPILTDIAARTGASYISMTQALCDPEGCLVATDTHTGAPMYLDIVHLTPTGSKLAVERIEDQLLP